MYENTPHAPTLSAPRRAAASVRKIRPVHPWAIVQMARGLRGMLGAGIGMHDAVRGLAIQFRVDSPRLAAILDDTANHLLAGGTLAQGFAAHRDQLGDTFVDLVEIGERGGVLPDKALPKIIELYRAKARFQAGALTALIYPVAVGLVSILVTWIALGLLVPALEDAFVSLGDPTALPALTRALRYCSNLFLAAISNVFVWAGVLGATVGGVLALRRPRIRAAVDAIVLRVPVLSRLVKLTDLSRVFATFSVLLDAGMSMREAIRLSSRSAASAVVREAFHACLPIVEAGGTLTKGIVHNDRVFDHSVRLMIATGEKTGTLPRQLQDLALQFQEEAAELRTRLERVLEIGSIVVLAIYVGAIALSIYLPIFTMIGKLAASR